MGKKILIVDDEEDMRVSLSFLVPDTAEVLEAENVFEAKQILEKDRIDLVITDLSMPVKEGITVSIFINVCISDQYKIPVFVVSGYLDPQIQEEYRGKPGIEFVQKPFDAGTFEQAISKKLNAA